jgi:hypothetical protein
MDENNLVPLLKQIKTLVEECLARIEDPATSQRGTIKRGIRPQGSKPKSIDFDKQIRAFVKQYAKGLGGPAKFVLLLSYMARGNAKQEVASKDIENQWSKMKSAGLLGMAFYPSYPMRAKENDWVNSKKRGLFYLRPSWQNIFTEPNG